MNWIIYAYFAIALAIGLTFSIYLSIRDGVGFDSTVIGLLFGLIWPMLIVGCIYWVIIIIGYKIRDVLLNDKQDEEPYR